VEETSLNITKKQNQSTPSAALMAHRELMKLAKTLYKEESIRQSMKIQRNSEILMQSKTTP
jgi:hypothetical protein